MYKLSKEDWRQALKLFGLYWVSSALCFCILVGAQQFLKEVFIYQAYLCLILIGLQSFIICNSMVGYGSRRYYENLAVIRQAKHENRAAEPGEMPFRVWRGFAIAAAVQLPVFLLVIAYAFMGEHLFPPLKILLNLWFVCFSQIKNVWPWPPVLLWVLCQLFMLAVTGWAYTYGRTKRRRVLSRIYQSRQTVRQQADPRGGLSDEEKAALDKKKPDNT